VDLPQPRVILAVAALAVVVVAGATSGEVPPEYLVTAVNYHFHDAHPTVPLTAGRDMVVKNATNSTTHNVTIPAIGVSQDIPPGGQIRIQNIASLFPGPGRYTMYCQYHASEGMRGVIVIAGSG
jgi:plastocyanin